ncbi:DUF4334 domain-containing protein [Sinorhizobium meliloti]|uniref:DUF4334 domain-containing protein n=1 Tax=Rhizobium meliloti TaxID=382 RepID=UPI0001E4B1C3|nr:DUF4334 domain-containing protein [Sinorhizobium meliloti]AEG56694.1 hypothetical protein Sinme_5037 [Sinorhizobium meliloti AK83]MDE4588359.1 DUF4334 domain-containing protein [Sinorhizobium meliloti]SEJ87228.1 GXWXG protein [Sinorhizobium meliloti]
MHLRASDADLPLYGMSIGALARKAFSTCSKKKTWDESLEFIPTGHPLDGVLENLGWFGKRFNADMRADALLFWSGKRRLIALDPGIVPLRLALRFHTIGRMRIARNLFSHLQRGLRAKVPVASLRTMPFSGVASAAMLYDDQPIVDYFRRIDQHRIMGAMTIRGDERIYFFELKRVDEP